MDRATGSPRPYGTLWDQKILCKKRFDADYFVIQQKIKVNPNLSFLFHTNNSLIIDFNLCNHVLHILCNVEFPHIYFDIPAISAHRTGSVQKYLDQLFRMYHLVIHINQAVFLYVMLSRTFNPFLYIIFHLFQYFTLVPFIPGFTPKKKGLIFS